MTDLATIDTHAVLTEPTTLRIQRLLPGPAERVWGYLVKSDLRRKWLASGEMPQQVGGKVELVWRNDELTTPSGKRPDGFPEEHRMEVQVTEIDPPHRLAITWGSTGGVSFELKPMGDQVLLTIVHQRIADPDTRLNISAGWHMHLDLLVASINGKPLPSPFWDVWSRLREDYQRRMQG